MPDIQPESASRLSRREVLTALGSLGLLTVLVTVVRDSLRFLTPPVSQTPPRIIIAGVPTDFPMGGLTALAAGPAFVGRDEAGLFALSAICTHLGCTLARSGKELACPCHGSRFGADGGNLAGPAAHPLPYLGLHLNDDGLVEVNLDQTVASTVRLKVTSL
ncbi:MAG: Rieske (2Fe-2S) protein [Anaerolineae bacterium]|nr:Rieske (2Fe-2S) protein [Anaerolineae bacterium]